MMGAVASFVLNLNLPPKALTLPEVQRIVEAVGCFEDDPGLLKTSIDGYFLASQPPETGSSDNKLSRVSSHILWLLKTEQLRCVIPFSPSPICVKSGRSLCFKPPPLIFDASLFFGRGRSSSVSSLDREVPNLNLHGKLGFLSLSIFLVVRP